MVHNVHWLDRSSIGCSCPKNLSQISMKNHGHMIFGFFPFSCNCTVLSVSIIPTRELLFSFQFFSISFCTALSDSTNWLDSLQFFFFSFWALSDYTNWLDSLQDFFNLFLNILVFKPFFFWKIQLNSNLLLIFDATISLRNVIPNISSKYSEIQSEWEVLR